MRVLRPTGELMARLYLIAEREEIERRKRLVSPSMVVEIWQDLYTPGIVWLGDDERRRIAYHAAREDVPPGLYWVGEASKRALDSVGEPLRFLLALDVEAVSVYYGPRLTDADSLPAEESLKARVLSAHGIGVVWMTYDRFGERTEYRPSSPTDPIFYLRRTRGNVAHLWRLFRTKSEAVAYVGEHFAADAAAQTWAAHLAARDFDELVERFGRKG
jgi:hypothetical protein